MTPTNRGPDGAAAPPPDDAPVPESGAHASGPAPALEPRDFIRQIVADDLAAGRYATIVTRFPPEPNGFLHIGHAKAITLNFGLALEVPGARCHLRFDDTNPETEKPEYVQSIQDTIRWLGFDWGDHLYFASDYFGRMYEIAERLVRGRHAYVDSQSEEEIRRNRGTITEPGTPSPFRSRSVEENLDLLRRMRAGEFPDGAHVLRAKIDMASPNMLLRDPVLYRIRHATHYRTGDDWCIYPLYDYAHPLEDAIEGVTHSLCSLEFETNRPLYDWVVEHANLPARPHQYEFARLNLDYTIMSKRKLLTLVKGGDVAGWDDPRLATLAGLRRRGVPPEAIRSFAELVGVAKTNSRVDIGKLEFTIRDELNRRVPRVLCVQRPLRVVVTNFPADRVEELQAPLYPHDVPLEGSRPLPFSREIFIERDDFATDPPRGWRRLSPGAEVRLRYAYFITCDEVITDEAGDVIELRCSYDPATRGGASPDGRSPAGTLHWVSAARSLPCEVRLYDRLFTVPDPDAVAADTSGDFTDFLNPDSLVVLPDARVEPSIADDPPGSRYQFERLGYFVSDAVDSRPDHLVFNRTVTLRDTWAKAQAGAVSMAGAAGAAGAGGAAGAPTAGGETSAGAAPARQASAQRAPGSAGAGREAPVAPERSAALQERRGRFETELGTSAEDAEILTREEATADFFEAALAAGARPQGVANWLVNELPREIGERTLEDLPFSARDFGELVRLVEVGALTSSAAREVLAELAREGGHPEEIVARRGLTQISDEAALARLVEEVVAGHPEKVADYRAGHTGLIGFFMGAVMRGSGGRANPEMARRLLETRLA